MLNLSLCVVVSLYLSCVVCIRASLILEILASQGKFPGHHCPLIYRWASGVGEKSVAYQQFTHCHEIVMVLAHGSPQVLSETGPHGGVSSERMQKAGQSSSSPDTWKIS